jgi:hypothetical protein
MKNQTIDLSNYKGLQELNVNQMQSIDGGGEFWDNMRNGSIAFWFCIIVVALYAGIRHLFIRIKEGGKLYDERGRRYYGYDSEGHRIYYKEKKPNILAEFIKAKYNKYCPKIDWKDERNNN